MGLWKRSDPKVPAENTIGVTQSQILSVSGTDAPPPPPRPSAKPGDMSMWGGNVMMSNDFAPDAARKRAGGTRRMLLVGFVVGVGAVAAVSAWVLLSRPDALAPKVAAPPVVAPPVAAPAPTPAPAVAPPAPAPVAPAPNMAASVPSEPAPVAKHAHAKKRHHHKKTKKRSHASR